jgi:hypothetical protein
MNNLQIPEGIEIPDNSNELQIPDIKKNLAYDPTLPLDSNQQGGDINVSMYELEQLNLKESIRHSLAGEIYDPKHGVWVHDKELGRPMNLRGVHFFMTKLSGHLDKNVTLSDFTVDQINEMLTEVCNDILEIFWKRNKEFEIIQANMNYILHIIEHQIFANYRRAKEGGERRHRETMVRYVENVRDSQQTSFNQPKGGIFGGLLKKKQDGGAF